MPNETENKGTGADGADAAKAVADKVADDAAAAAAAAGNGGGTEETVTIKKSEWDKTKSDLKNYRQATIGKKADERKLDGQGGKGKGEGEGGGQGGQGTARVRSTPRGMRGLRRGGRDGRTGSLLFLR